MALREDARDSPRPCWHGRAAGGGDRRARRRRHPPGRRQACGDIPLCALSTGTNNAFPELRETTVAGLATGLVATGRLGGDELVRRAKQLEVAVDGGARDLALVDVAVTAERLIGVARAVAAGRSRSCS